MDDIKGDPSPSCYDYLPTGKASRFLKNPKEGAMSVWEPLVCKDERAEDGKDRTGMAANILSFFRYNYRLTRAKDFKVYTAITVVPRKRILIRSVKNVVL